MSSTMILRGNIRESFLIGPTLTPASVTNATSSNQTFTIPGILATDYIVCLGVVGTQTSGIIVAEADATAANTVAVQFANCSAAPATPAAGMYLFQVIRMDTPVPATAG
jgi:hypothetical protein